MLLSHDFQSAAILVLFSYAGRFVLVSMTHVGKNSGFFLRLDRWEVIFKKRLIAAFVDFRADFKVSRSREPLKLIRGQSFD